MVTGADPDFSLLAGNDGHCPHLGRSLRTVIVYYGEREPMAQTNERLFHQVVAKAGAGEDEGHVKRQTLERERQLVHVPGEGRGQRLRQKVK